MENEYKCRKILKLLKKKVKAGRQGCKEVIKCMDLKDNI